MTFTTVTPAAHVVGAQPARDVKVNADEVKSPTEVSVLTPIVDPGVTTGWHSHPGLAVIAVAERTG